MYVDLAFWCNDPNTPELVLYNDGITIVTTSDGYSDADDEPNFWHYSGLGNHFYMTFHELSIIDGGSDVLT